MGLTVAEVVLIALVGGGLSYSAFLAVFFVRALFKKGNLKDPPKKFTIPPPYLRERDEARARARSAAINEPLRGNSQYLTRSNTIDSTVTTTSLLSTPGVQVNRWTGEVVVDTALVRDRQLRREAEEQRRISRLPTFEQDDCGDGRNFPEVPYVGIEHLKPLPLRRFRPDPPVYMAMGLRKLDAKEWLSIDQSYTTFHEARAELLAEMREECIQVTQEGEEACVELMQEVVEFLLKRYPEHFQIHDCGFGRKKIENRITGEEFDLQRPWTCYPLEMCARLAMEDFNILHKGAFTGEHYLTASATVFPAGWRLRERIGKSVADLHGPVPLWKDVSEILNASYFTRLSPSSCMQRSSLFIQIAPADRHLEEILFAQHGKDLFAGDICNLLPRDILIRRESQIFRRLPKSGAVVFTVHTSLEKLTDLPESEHASLVAEIRSWPNEIARYKGRDLWQRAVMGWCEGSRATYHDDDNVGSDTGSFTRVDDD
ncbi:hypothetical protein B0J11DRAFT_448750 [Dendryphion nanum]|uniref:Uncharacterized protein n=1 Tax=Dendryphion nanum TaxID=256645 RepID=A0A9P9CZG5_9PLEO|nr:hypothetical protein B0J11DRAFT_448750 [Dendryphion nanum]